MGVPHQSRQAHQVQKEFRAADGLQPSLDLRLQRQELALRRVGEGVRVEARQDLFIEKIQVLLPLLGAQRLRRQGRDHQQRRQTQPRRPPEQAVCHFHKYDLHFTSSIIQ